MATEKNPSIYYDRGTIGSSDELDEYGVWVKSEPQDLSSVNKDSSDIQESSLPGLDDLPDLDEPENIPFTNDDPDMLNLPDMDDTLPDDLNISLDMGTPDELELPDMEDLDSFDDISFPDEAEASPGDLDLDIPEMDDTPVPEDDGFDLDISFDDSEPAAVEEEIDEMEAPGEKTDKHGFTEVSMDDFISDTSGTDENLDITKTIHADEKEDELLDIDFDSIESSTGETGDLPDIDSIMSLDEDNSFSDDEPITIDDIDEENLSSITPDSGDNSFDEEDEPITIDDLDEENRSSINLSGEDTSFDQDDDEPITIDDIDEANRSSINFDDVAALGDDLQKDTYHKEEKEDIPTELLLKIAHELSSIREELSSLKNELSAIKSEPAAEPLAQEILPTDESKGFFDEEEDDKIALTGDELDNILNTADFTEEAGEDANTIIEDTLPGPSAEESGGFLYDQPDILSGDEEPAGTQDKSGDANTDFNVDEISLDLDSEAVSGETTNDDFDALDLDLPEMEDTLDAGEETAASATEEISLDLDGEAVTGETTNGDFDALDLDLPEMEDTLDAEEETAASAAEEISLDLDGEAVTGENDGDEFDVLDLDLPEMEDTLDVGEETAASAAEEISLDLDGEAVTGENDGDEFDVLDLDLPEMEDTLDAGEETSASIEDEFSLETEDPGSVPENAEEITEEISFSVPGETVPAEKDETITEVFSFGDPDDEDQAAVEDAGSGEFALDDLDLDMESAGDPETGEEADDLISTPESDIIDTEAEEVSGLELDELTLEESIKDKETDELRQLREEGARYVTEAPDDVSYLEEEPLEIEDDAIDLSQAVIDEPDFSDIVENPVEEPSLENLSIDLDLEEEPLLTEELDSELDGDHQEEEVELSLPELETGDLSIPGLTQEEPEEESFAQVIPEGFVVEADDSESMLDDPEMDFEEIEPVLPEDETILAPLEEEANLLADDLTMEEVIPDSQDNEIPVLKTAGEEAIPANLKQELKTVLSYMDKLLESLPEDKIEEFAKSEYFDTYKKLFEELGLV